MTNHHYPPPHSHGQQRAVIGFASRWMDLADFLILMEHSHLCCFSTAPFVAGCCHFPSRLAQASHQNTFIFIASPLLVANEYFTSCSMADIKELKENNPDFAFVLVEAKQQVKIKPLCLSNDASFYISCSHPVEKIWKTLPRMIWPHLVMPLPVMFCPPIPTSPRVQKAVMINKEWRYFVHYLGGNKTSWDEWVGEDRLLKHTEENVMKQKALDKKHNADKKVKSRRPNRTKAKKFLDAKVDKEDVKNSASEGKKRKHDSGVEKVCVTIEKLVKIQIPATLKEQLVDDWNFVVQQDKLVELPRSPTVDETLTMYLDYKTKKDSKVAISVGEILKGIRLCFDRALPIALLYTKERKQYRETVADSVSPSTIYGAEHLLRLFVKLPKLLPYMDVEDETLNYMQQKTLNYMQQIFLDFLKSDLLLRSMDRSFSCFFFLRFLRSRCAAAFVASWFLLRVRA